MHDLPRPSLALLLIDRTHLFNRLDHPHRPYRAKGHEHAAASLLFDGVRCGLGTPKQDAYQEERDRRHDSVTDDTDVPNLHIGKRDTEQAGKAQDTAYD